MWKKLCVWGMSAVLIGALLAGCGEAKKESAAEKAENPPTASFPLGTGQANLYEMKGDVTLPTLEQKKKAAAAVMGDSIYVFAAPEQPDAYLLKRIRFKDHTLLAISDIGMSQHPYVYGNQKYVWFCKKEDHEKMLVVFDGEKLTSKRYIDDYATPRSTIFSNRLYFEGHDSHFRTGTIEGGEFREGPIVLKEWWIPLKARHEAGGGFAGADEQHVYLSAFLKEDKAKGSASSVCVYAYAADGTEVRGFDMNAAKDQGAEVHPHRGDDCVAITKAYVVFLSSDFVRVFRKQDGGYVGDFSLRVNEEKLSVRVAVAMGENDILLLCREQPAKLYRLSL